MFNVIPSSDFSSACKPHDGPEIVFGLVSPTGTSVEDVCHLLEEALKEFGYSTELISLSALIDHATKDAGKSLAEDQRIDHLMKQGTYLREQAQRGDIAALLAVGGIRQVRAERNGAADPDVPAARTAYVLRSLKTPEEVETLRVIYGHAFFLISIYSSEKERIEKLSQRIAQSNYRSDASQYRPIAQELINKDKNDDRDFGQRVGDTFPLADFFLRFELAAAMRAHLFRFVSLIFGNPFITPTKDEFGMFSARTAAMRSADLARQIGAAIATSDGDLISVGCNDVPKFGGGLYWEGDPNDCRDFKTGSDSSSVNRKRALIEFFNRVQQAGWLQLPDKVKNLEQLVDRVIAGEEKAIFKNAQALSVIEYGRSVHAEMAAIADAARRGVSIADSVLFSTTFPCHICARHIIATGIKRVLYIEPYPKSKAEELYSDSIEVNPDTRSATKVTFEPFVGVAPTKYFQLFGLSVDRKDDFGKVIDWDDDKAKKNPRFKRFVLSYIQMEQVFMSNIVRPFLEGLEED